MITEDRQGGSKQYHWYKVYERQLTTEVANVMVQFMSIWEKFDEDEESTKIYAMKIKIFEKVWSEKPQAKNER